MLKFLTGMVGFPFFTGIPLVSVLHIFRARSGHVVTSCMSPWGAGLLPLFAGDSCCPHDSVALRLLVRARD